MSNQLNVETKMYLLTIFLSLFGANVAASTASPVGESSLTSNISLGDGHDHLLMASIDTAAFANITDVNMTAMNYYEYEKAINWPGVYDMVDFGFPAVIPIGGVRDPLDREEQTRDERALAIVDLIDHDHSAFRGAGNESSIYERFDYSGEYNADHYKRFNWFNRTKLQFRSAEKFYKFYMALITESFSDSVSKMLSAISDMNRRSTKKYCGHSTRWYNAYNSAGTKVTYLVALSPWTTGKKCDTQVTNTMVVDELEANLQKSYNDNGIAWCLPFKNDGTWRSNARFLLWVETKCWYYNWAVPCPD